MTLTLSAALALGAPGLPAQCGTAACPVAGGAAESANTDGAPLTPENGAYSFKDVNVVFRKNYAEAKAEIRRKLGPVILCEGDELVLLRGKSRQTSKFIRSPYQRLKEVDHITLGTYVILINHVGDRALPEKTLKRLDEFGAAIARAEENLEADGEGITKRQLPRQLEIIKRTRQFLAAVKENGRVSHAELTAYTRAVAGLDLANAYEAVSDQLATIDSIVASWRQEMTEDDWARLYVVISTGHMPRKQQAALQYFKRLLDQPVEGDRIITIETMDNEEQAIDLLLTHILDRNVAIDFFKDPWRMHRDLLADGARKFLESKEKLEAEKVSAGKEAKSEPEQGEKAH